MVRIELQENNGWSFFRGTPEVPRDKDHGPLGPWSIQYDDAQWEQISLPHTVRTEPLMASGGVNYQGIAWYRKRITIGEDLAAMDLLFELEGAMQRVDAWFDGEPLGIMNGGFLPGAFDLTGKLVPGREHLIALKVDNSDMPDVPPGKPQNTLDFCYFGGLYRDAWLKAAGKLRFSYAVHEGKPASGGIRVSYPTVTKEAAELEVLAHVLNHKGSSARPRLQLLLDGLPVASGEPFAIPAGGDGEALLRFMVKAPRLWHPRNPNLYTLTARLVDEKNEEEIFDEIIERIGIRSVEFTGEGFFINHERFFLSGANRHQEFPYAGFAITDALQKRDAVILRRAGMTCVRTAHYPQDKAFMDACDELGIVCVIPTPGWQNHPDSAAFDFASYENTRRLIRYNRNHPSAVLWEPILNETDYPEYFAKKQLEIVRQESPGQAWAACDSHYAFAPEYPVNYNTKDGKPVFIREYGDNWIEQFGANYPEKPGPRKTLRRVRRGGHTGFYSGGERAMIRNAEERFESYFALRMIHGINGACMWAGIDHNRGYVNNEAAVGILDFFRLPKFVYYLYEAQQEIGEAGAKIFIASYWTEDSPRDVTVYSNAEAVRLSLNGAEIAVLSAAEGWAATPLLANSESEEFTHENLFNDRVPEGIHPPFTFKGVPFEPGILQAEALVDGKPVAVHRVRTPGAARRLRLAPHWAGVETWIADGSDLLLCHVFADDENGVTVPSEEREVRFSVSGGAGIVGDGDPRVQANPIPLEAGATGILLRAGLMPGRVILRAEAEGLESAELTLQTRENKTQR
jgi:beta-galactosidase